MQSEAGNIHISDGTGGVEPGENITQFNDVLSNHSAVNRPPRRGVSVPYDGTTESFCTVTRYVTDVKCEHVLKSLS
jgi:hypothetical protein